jgi:hypothetical protein
VITPRRDLDDEHARLLTYDRAHAASTEHLDAVASVSADISAMIAGGAVSSGVHPMDADHVARDQPWDESVDDVTYRAALAALSGVVQRSLRDFLA